MAGVKQMTYSSGDETYLIQLLSAFFQKVGFSTERQELYMPQILSYAKKFREISGKPCVSLSQTDQETHEELQKQRWNLMEMELHTLFHKLALRSLKIQQCLQNGQQNQLAHLLSQSLLIQLISVTR
jgi:hypothetical protein